MKYKNLLSCYLIIYYNAGKLIKEKKEETEHKLWN